MGLTKQPHAILVNCSKKQYLLFLAGMSLIAPGFSTAGVGMDKANSSLAFFSVVSRIGGGEARFSEEGSDNGRIVVPGIGAVAAGFLRPLRDGGGGASSVRPCERN